MVEVDSVKYRVYSMRWAQLLIYFLSTFANGMTSMTFVPIVRQTSKYFQITTNEVNLLSILFMFLYIVGASLSIYCGRSVSLRWSMIIGSLLNLGAFIRLVAFIDPHNGYSALVVGQIFPAIAAPFFLNSTALFAARWFAAEQRDIATAIGSMANPIGGAIGSVLPSLIVGADATFEQFFLLITIESGLVGLTAVLTIFFFQSEPPSPPSASEEHQHSIHIKEDLLRLLRNRHYMTLLAGFSLGLALINAITALLFQIIEPFGYTSDNAGIFGALIILSGIFNAFIAGFLMDRTHAYRMILKVLLIGASLSILFFVLILRPNHLYSLAISIGLMGFFLLPLLPVCFECAVECTYPVRPEWSTGLFLCIGSILGGLFIFLLGYLVKLEPILHSPILLTPASLFIFFIFMTSALLLFIYNGPYLRLEAERQATLGAHLNT